MCVSLILTIKLPKLSINSEILIKNSNYGLVKVI